MMNPKKLAIRRDQRNALLRILKEQRIIQEASIPKEVPNQAIS